MAYMKAYEKWLNDPAIDGATKAELEGLKGNEAEIQDRFFKELEFGTGGMRGVLGAGTNRLNIYTIRKATQGLANYILASDAYKDGMGVAIAHDCRRMSPEFSQEAALVLNANGIKTYVFDSLRPTPLLSFAVRELGCVSGIVVTASHNPPEYNGYKVYWADGGQCPYPRDEAIIAEVNKITDFSMVKTLPLAEAKEKGLYNVAGPAVDDAFIGHVKGCLQNPQIIPESDIKIVFTPLHGAGNISTQRALKESGFKNVFVVSRQEQPDGNFPTVGYPNPEDKKAFALALELAKEKDADIALATDPDCDRVGLAVKHDGDYVLLTGNQTGVILTEYLLSQMKEKGTLPANAAIISTIVSTDMTRAIAKEYGATYMEVLTGFKYIGEKIKEFEESNSHTYIIGFEESYGYLTGTYARDKDAVAATLLACEAAAFYRKQGLSLYEVLQKLYAKYGEYRESIVSITMQGVAGLEDIKRILTRLRTTPPAALGGSKVIEARDYASKEVKNLANGSVTATGLPVSDVLYYATEDGSWACVRPSGTEPKIKLYFGVKSGGTEKLDALAKDMKDAAGA
ncbi:MAG: phospho-sugar mutase [Defluviitaleaceae bacterium]|nr:phospho-sugar mutase [Defluviitaleaceae bacterium]MCL2273865.1 phospho-sugar mutase [Defluviitaleaceae bacterium]